MGICSFSAYCINTGLGTYSQYDGIYSAVGVYNTYLYYTGDTTPVSYLYYFTSVTLDNRWCLSTSLGGSCILFGRTPCLSDCPDLDEGYFNTGICPSPTPTMTPHCQLDFSSIFDCNVIPTPTPTPTVTTTTTPTPTVTQSSPCPVDADITINIFPPAASPTPTPTITPTSSGFCSNVGGTITSNMLTGIISCDQVNKFELCRQSPNDPVTYFYTSSSSYLPNGDSISANSIYTAYINGSPFVSCVTYIGLVANVGNESTVSLVNGPFNDCTICFPSPTPTPSPTITPTLTKTPTPTPTPTQTKANPFRKWYVYQRCTPTLDNKEVFVVDTVYPPSNVPSPLNVGECFGATTNITINPIIYYCWSYVGNYIGTSTGVVQSGGTLYGGLTVVSGVGIVTPISSTIGDYFTSQPTWKTDGSKSLNCTECKGRSNYL
jgi:hypothetical protein